MTSTKARKGVLREAARRRLAALLDEHDRDVFHHLDAETERADLWTEIEVNVEDLRAYLSQPEQPALRAERDHQWRTIDGWISAGGDENAENYARQMAAQIGLGFRTLYTSPPVSPDVAAQLRDWIWQQIEQHGDDLVAMRPAFDLILNKIDEFTGGTLPDVAGNRK